MNNSVPDLTSAKRKELRGKAMNLKPKIKIGKSGVTQTILAATEFSLSRDNLIKIEVDHPDKEERKRIIHAISTRTGAAVCGITGKTASLYRPPHKPISLA